MEFLLLWLAMGVIVAMIAAAKGRNPFLWGLYGLALFIVAIVHVLVIPKTPEAIREDAKAAGRVPCPSCAEMIMRDAKICPFCREAVASAIAEQGHNQAIAKGPAVQSADKPGSKAVPLIFATFSIMLLGLLALHAVAK